MNIHKLLSAVLLFALFSECFSQTPDAGMTALLDMMYMCPYNYNSADIPFKKSKVKSVTADYAGYRIVMNVNGEGLRVSTDIDSIAVFKYKYYDDGRMSDLELTMKGYENVRTRMLFTYGSPLADFDAVFLFPENVGSEQTASFFCDEKGRVIRMSMGVQKLETVKCSFEYSPERINKIIYTESGPEYFSKLNIAAVYAYRQDGLIDTETVTMPDGKEITVYYKYYFYE